MAGPKAFGSTSRFSDPSNVPSASIVRILGQKVDFNVPESAFAGTLSGTIDDFDPALYLANADWLASGALGYAVRLGGTTIDRLRAGGDDTDNQATQSIGASLVLARNYLFDGATWDRQRSAGAAALASLSAQGALLQTTPGEWSVNHVPAVATQATASRAAGGAGVRNICRSIDATLIIQPTVNQPVIQLNLRDGATGGGTILWSRQFGVGAALAAGGQQIVSLAGLNIVGSANTAMTLEFSAAGAALTYQSVAMTGYLAS